ncbi:MAG: hypothetical protein WCE35_16055, partial [Bradyrhizobium sp.]
MIKTAIRLAALAIFLMALVAAPSLMSALAAGGGGGGDSDSVTSPAPGTRSTPANKTTHKSKKKATKQSSLDDAGFVQGYRAAYAAIYDRNAYADAIGQLKALGHDDHPNVANLIGYSYR